MSNKKYISFTTENTPEAMEKLAASDMLGLQEEPNVIHAWFAEGTDLGTLCADLIGSVEVIEEVNWAEKWRELIKSVRVGPLLIVPPWLASTAAEPEGVLNAVREIIIEPEMAFGTGDHATTRGCLSALVRHVFAGATVLDFGCGSGILGIAAGRLGAARIVCVDSDPMAVEIARKNAAINGVALEVVLADEPPLETFDIVVANIASSVLMPIEDRLRTCARGGVLILSGILAEEKISFDPIAGRTIEGVWRTLEIRPS